MSERVTAAPDALLFRINLSIKGDTERHLWGPACHLTALGPREKSRALKVLRVIAGIVEYRSQQPRDTANWAPSAGDPHLVLIIDEIDALTELPPCRQALEHLASKGREFGVTIVRAGQRGTAEWTGGGNVRAVDGVFCIGKVNRSMEAMHAAGDLGLQLPNMAEYGEGQPGVWAIAELDGRHQAGRAFNLSGPEDVRAIVRERAHSQPDLQPELKAFLGDSYENLLSTDVYAKWARDQRGPVAHPRPDAPAEVASGAAPAAVATVTGLDAYDRDMEDHLASLERRPAAPPLARPGEAQRRDAPHPRRVRGRAAAGPHARAARRARERAVGRRSRAHRHPGRHARAAARPRRGGGDQRPRGRRRARHPRRITQEGPGLAGTAPPGRPHLHRRQRPQHPVEAHPATRGS